MKNFIPHLLAASWKLDHTFLSTDRSNSTQSHHPLRITQTIIKYIIIKKKKKADNCKNPTFFPFRSQSLAPWTQAKA